MEGRNGSVTRGGGEADVTEVTCPHTQLWRLSWTPAGVSVHGILRPESWGGGIPSPGGFLTQGLSWCLELQADLWPEPPHATVKIGCSNPKDWVTVLKQNYVNTTYLFAFKKLQWKMKIPATGGQTHTGSHKCEKEVSIINAYVQRKSWLPARFCMVSKCFCRGL